MNKSSSIHVYVAEADARWLEAYRQQQAKKFPFKLESMSQTIAACVRFFRASIEGETRKRIPKVSAFNCSRCGAYGSGAAETADGKPKTGYVCLMCLTSEAQAQDSAPPLELESHAAIQAQDGLEERNVALRHAGTAQGDSAGEAADLERPGRIG